MSDLVSRPLPAVLEPLRDLALDLRWTWSHAADHLWRELDPDGWERSENPCTILQEISTERLRQVAADAAFTGELTRLAELRRATLEAPAWFARAHGGEALRRVAYFCMEFALGEALPLYAGGLGVLAGDYLKTASDLGVPVAAVGLLYQEGYFRQALDAQGRQQEIFPFSDPGGLPVEPVRAGDGAWMHVTLDLPGRALRLRLWQARVGRATLYLLDSNDPLNAPVDRGITGKLYGGGRELRLMQEIVLGVGGWRALEALGLDIDICHLNEGHAAFAVLERVRSCMRRTGLSFAEALWTTRAANVFTTHTSVEAGFDRYGPDIVERFRPLVERYASELGVGARELLALGRRNGDDEREPFNMAYLAMRGSIATNAVSRLHGEVSRALFRDLYPRWPERKVPVTHVTNGVHVPTWDSPRADALWEEACGKERWRGTLEVIPEMIDCVSDDVLWTFRNAQRHDLVEAVRRRLALQLGFAGADDASIERAGHIFDPEVLTIGFARRFATYKRVNLLLRDRGRLIRLLTDGRRPVQLVVAGKAHPDDGGGKELVREWVEFAREPAVRDRVVFLEDYDLALAQDLVRGVDLWVNTPRRPWEACGTSGMKVLVNGGLNLSTLDGWWDEAYEPAVGWALDGDAARADGDADARDAEELYAVLERSVLPEFYTRDERGIPVQWVARVRASMARLTPRFSANRMLREYVESLYLPAAELARARHASDGALGKALHAWHARLAAAWHTMRFGRVTDARDDGTERSMAVEVDFGAVSPDDVRVELCADPRGDDAAIRVQMARVDSRPSGGRLPVYAATVSTTRSIWDFTPRIVPFHPAARVPAEAPFILWQR